MSEARDARASKDSRQREHQVYVIKTQREMATLTQEMAAERAGWSLQKWRDVEDGVRIIDEPEMARVLSEILGSTPDYYLCAGSDLAPVICAGNDEAASEDADKHRQEILDNLDKASVRRARELISVIDGSPSGDEAVRAIWSKLGPHEDLADDGIAISPTHYARLSPQPIEVIEAWKLGFHLGNAVKYIARAGYKGNRVEDLKKAVWYLERAIATTEDE